MILIACILLSISVYLMLEAYVLKKFLGIILLSTTINLLIFICGQAGGIKPVFWQRGANLIQLGNPLAQAI